MAVTFSNGKPFTSQDVSCSRSATRWNNRDEYFPVRRCDADPECSPSVQTPDDYTVIIKTREPLPVMPAEVSPLAADIIWNEASSRMAS